MIKKVQVFRCSDGEDFDSENDANRHDEMVQISECEIRKIISDDKDTCDFANGSGYYQLEPLQVSNLKTSFLAAVKKYYPELSKYGIGTYGLSRTLSDNDSPLYRIDSFIQRIDEQNRLWGQIYFANHPEKANNKKLN